MGPAGRDRRMRAGQELLRRSKRRTPGARAEDSGSEVEPAEVVEVLESPAEPASSSRRPTVPYTDPRQTTPGRKQGRVRTSGRTQLGSRLSLAELYTASLSQLVWFLVNFGFLAGTPPPGGCKCQNLARSSWKLEETKEKCLWRCKGCRKTVGVFARDQDL